MNIIGLVLNVTFRVTDRRMIFPGDLMAFIYSSLKNDKLTNAAHQDQEKTPPFRIKQVQRKKDILNLKVAFLSEGTANHFLKSVMKTGLCVKTTVYPLLDGRGEKALRLPAQWRHLPAKAVVILDFQTPTFIRKGKIDMPLPVPVSVLGSIFRSITAYSAISFPENIFEKIEEYVSVHRMQNINTMPVHISENTYRIGFTGQVEFRLHSKAPFFMGQVLSLLTAWVPFTGVGAKTAYGFGSVEVLEQWQDASVANG